MVVKVEKIDAVLEEIDEILERIQQAEHTYASQLANVHPLFKHSALNLIHYRALRSMDIRSLQRRLGNMSLSRLAKAEGHVKASLLASRTILNALKGNPPDESDASAFSIKKARKILNTHTKELLGFRSKGRRVRIMVTFPSEAAHDYSLVESLLACGMNTARINCAHDGPEEWKLMIQNLQKAKSRLKKNCKISMDLGGPKIRTGEMIQGPKVKHFRPTRDSFGRVTEPFQVILVPENYQLQQDNTLPVSVHWLSQINTGDEIKFQDTRGKNRSFAVIGKRGEEVVANCYDGCYIGTGTKLQISSQDGIPETEVGELPATVESLNLKIGDRLILHKDPKLGEPAQYGQDGELLEHAHISCTAPEIFNSILPGEKFLFDDGKIAGIVGLADPEYLEIEIEYAKPVGSKLRADKGINLPQSQLLISGLTVKDKEDLKFIARHADVVSFSFVNSPQDVSELLAEIESLGATNKLGVILKIETQSAFNNLADILLEAMRIHPVGVMIARGDLAIETGWENIARVQSEILSLCYAAHIPNIWATQVLENMAKKGIPSRAEITDAATSLRSECVMLNKGPHITNAIRLLDHILRTLEDYQDKNAPMLPQMKEVKI